MDVRYLDISGMRFGNLVAIGKTPDKARGRPIWKFVCDCGSEVLSVRQNIVNGHKRSCGCLRTTAAKRASDCAKTHGKAGSPIYRVWRAMIGRCIYPGTNGYESYGGRGITVCDRWLRSFENFYADMGERPFKGAQIDRYPNNDGNYEPSNCRWATPKDNCKTRRRPRRRIASVH